MTQEHKVIQLTVNGVEMQAQAEPRMLLADFLRHELKLKGTHVGCAHGACGACTVVVDGQPSRSCLMFAVQAQDTFITTVEGLSSEDGLSVLQQEFQRHHALQCGFCTPGMLISAQALLDRNLDPSDEEIRAWLAGNLCRCTGYEGIVNAVKAAARRIQTEQGW
jgi:aerobic-type carbon monoxide dehydrogenase small subunit (CoxS/CutS family)